MPPKKTRKTSSKKQEAHASGDENAAKKRREEERRKKEEAARSPSPPPAARSPSPPPAARSPSPPPEDGEEDTAQPTKSSTSSGATRKKRKCPVILTEEQEIDMGEWLAQNPMLYSKSMKEYKNTLKKNRLWDEKAAELALESGQLLRTWYESVRTRVGKVALKTSGSAALEHTDRDKFIMAHFSFLGTHISRMRGRSACSTLQSALREGKSMSRSRHSESEEDGDGFREDDDNISSQQPSQPSQPPTSKGKSSFVGARTKSKPKGTSERVEDDDLQVLEGLNTQQKRSEQIQLKIAEQLNRDEQSPTAVWGTWLGLMAGRNIDERLHERFYRESMDLVLGLAAESKQLHAIRPPQQQQHQQYQQPSQMQQPHQPPQLNTPTFMEMLAPHTWQQPQQQQQHAVDQPSTSHTSWDTLRPTSGQHMINEERPGGTPNMCFSNVSNFSELLGTSHTHGDRE